MGLDKSSITNLWFNKNTETIDHACVLDYAAMMVLLYFVNPIKSFKLCIIVAKIYINYPHYQTNTMIFLIGNTGFHVSQFNYIRGTEIITETILDYKGFIFFLPKRQDMMRLLQVLD
jgi:hypothetical protein